MNEDQLKETVIDYFRKKRYDERMIPKTHFDIIHEIDDELTIRIEPLLDRNYSHSTDFVLILNPKGWINRTYEFMGDEEVGVLKNTPDHIHWALLFKLSLTGEVATCIFNSRRLVDDEIQVEQVSANDLPVELQSRIMSIVHIMESYNYQFVSLEELEQQKDWANAIFKFRDGYQPTLYDLLFGSFELYTEADI
ncbi:hypothetical protein G5B10_06225 [Fluviicola sp. SGL-29]|nr:hypothetical protein [Fluviicola sp. SGL-29]